MIELSDSQIREIIAKELEAAGIKSSGTAYKLLFRLAKLKGQKMNGAAKRIQKLYRDDNCGEGLSDKQIKTMIFHSLRHYIESGELILPQEFKRSGLTKKQQARRGKKATTAATVNAGDAAVLSAYKHKVPGLPEQPKSKKTKRVNVNTDVKGKTTHHIIDPQNQKGLRGPGIQRETRESLKRRDNAQQMMKIEQYAKENKISITQAMVALMDDKNVEPRKRRKPSESKLTPSTIKPENTESKVDSTTGLALDVVFTKSRKGQRRSAGREVGTPQMKTGNKGKYRSH